MLLPLSERKCYRARREKGVYTMVTPAVRLHYTVYLIFVFFQ
jgi:hypothetical protein